MTGYYRPCPHCGFSIPDTATVCGHCTRNVGQYVPPEPGFFGKIADFIGGMISLVFLIWIVSVVWSWIFG